MHSSLIIRGLLLAGLVTAVYPAGARAQDAAKSAEPVTVPLVNTTFKDEDKNGIPDGWKDYPGVVGNTAITPDAAGGVKLKDDDEGNGIGLAQWIPVTPGADYMAAVELEGTGSVSLNLIFVPSIPAKEAMVGQIQLSTVREFYPSAGGKQVTAKAPEGSKYARVWLYCPKSGKCDVLVKSITLKTIGGTTTPMAAAVAKTGKPSAGATDSSKLVEPPRNDHGQKHPDSTLKDGNLGLMDFETGDLSQSRLMEGGKYEVVTAPEPVRAGKYSMKVSLRHDKVRSEATSFRSPADGIAKYGWSLYLPNEFDGMTQFSIVSQWHTWGSGRVAIIHPPGPPTCIVISKNTWSLLLRYQDPDNKEQYMATKKEFSFGDITADKGKWTDFVMEVCWRGPKEGNGYLRLYKNGEKVVDYEGITYFDDATSGPFFKMGVYKGAGKWKGEEAGAVLYCDEFRMAGKETPTYLVDPNPERRAAGGNAPVPPIQPANANNPNKTAAAATPAPAPEPAK
ncbi:hypothetical protein DB346_07975 [Verrucomicrobia bacterium LW23]|nr:hypothetical protein DB346_07975 [Verrucomicrobia bacterium LW23]